MNYRSLTEVAQLEEIKSLSEQQPVLIFKHSTRCPVSSMVRSRFERAWDVSENDIPVYLLDLIRYRDVSNAVAQEFGIDHESPQILLIENGACVYDNSHHGIRPEEIKKQALNA